MDHLKNEYKATGFEHGCGKAEKLPNGMRYLEINIEMTTTEEQSSTKAV